MAEERDICLRREELVLRGHGRIAVGHRVSDEDAVLVEFYCI
jgi:hypothetical protein